MTYIRYFKYIKMNVEMEISSYITSICQSINNLDPFEYKKMGKYSIINMIKNFYQVYISIFT